VWSSGIHVHVRKRSKWWVFLIFPVGSELRIPFAFLSIRALTQWNTCTYERRFNIIAGKLEIIIASQLFIRAQNMDGITAGIKSVTQTKLALLILKWLDSRLPIPRRVLFHYMFVDCYVAISLSLNIDYYIDKKRIARVTLYWSNPLINRSARKLIRQDLSIKRHANRCSDISTMSRDWSSNI